LWPRWIFLRALAVIFFSAFYSLAFQIHGLIGPRGILPARDFHDDVHDRFGPLGRIWYAPTLLWLGAGDRALTIVVAAGLVASVLLFVNLVPRAMLVVCVLCFLSFVAAGQDFADYQSDGMLLEAGFLSFFFAPRGLRPRLGAASPPSRAAHFLLVWEWFRIYFESGFVKLASGDPQWRALTAMDHYYENGPLPTWLGWYVQMRGPHFVHAATALATLVIELLLVWVVLFGRRARIVVFAIVTPLQIGIILTANYAFLNYLVLALGILLVDDRALARLRLRAPRVEAIDTSAPDRSIAARVRVWGEALVLSWIFYATLAVWFMVPEPLSWPWAILAHARIANRYGLFAVMTEARYEIEFQGTRDGVTWVPYPFRYKPQDIDKAPGIYAPYQPRFEWNLWFASLGAWRSNEWVVEAEERLMEQEPSVVALFASDPFAGDPPRAVRTVTWRYWFTDPETKRHTGAWWRREPLEPYAPALTRDEDGTIVQIPAERQPSFGSK
jgi:hypothetical protein